jgi:hypothetical protein
LLLDLSVRNLGNEALPLDAALVTLEGHEYERAQPPGLNPALTMPIAPAADLRGEIAFLIEDSATYSTFLYGLGGLVWAIQLDRLLER